MQRFLHCSEVLLYSEAVQFFVVVQVLDSLVYVKAHEAQAGAEALQ